MRLRLRRSSVKFRSAIIVLGAICSASVVADSYTGWQAVNVAYVINDKHSDSPFAACVDAGGFFVDATLTVSVVSGSFNPGTGVCTLQLDNGTAGAVTISSVSPSCSDDIIFDFDRQQCVDGVGVDAQYAVMLAGFCWLCLIGGILTGLKMVG